MPRRSMQPMNSRPTAPVAPTMATVLLRMVKGPLQAIKKPRPDGRGDFGRCAWRDCIYACATAPGPEAMVFVVVVVRTIKVIGDALTRRLSPRQGVAGQKKFNRL